MQILKTISSFLPPPNFLRLPSVGVDISDSSMKYIEFRPDRKIGQSLELINWGELDLPEGALERGEVKDPKQFSSTLRQIKEKTGTDFVRISLPEERAYLFETKVKKGTSFKEVRGQLEFHLEENVPISPRDAFFDYHIFGEEAEEKEVTVAVTVYTKDTINAYYHACLEAGVTPVSFEVEAQAITRAALPRGGKGTYLILDFGRTRTGIGIVHRGALMYTSTIDIGGNELSAALRRQLGDKEESELTIIKNQEGLVRRSTDGKSYEALVSTVSAIKDEILLRLQYWNNREDRGHDRFIEKIILCGGSANLKGLPEYLTETLGIDAMRADVWQNAFAIDHFVPPIDLPHSYGYATAIGLGLTSFV